MSSQWIDSSILIPGWNVNGNIYPYFQLNKTVVQGHVDISGGNLILRNGGLFTQTDISSNGNLYAAKSFISGNLAIGKTTAGFPLDVNGIINATSYYQGGVPYVGSQWTTGTGNISYSGGNVGIGTASPAYQLDVNGNTRVSRITLNGTSGTGFLGPHLWAYTSANSTHPLFQILNYTNNNISINMDMYYNGTNWVNSDLNNNGWQILKLANQLNFNYTIQTLAGSTVALNTGMTINTSGQVTATSFNSTSDYRIKTDIIPLNTTIDNIDNLQSYSYTNIRTNHKDFGFIAHEVQQYFPFMVNGAKDATDIDGNPILQSINYQAIIPILVAEVKELKNIVTKQQEQINSLIQYINTTTNGI